MIASRTVMWKVKGVKREIRTKTVNIYQFLLHFISQSISV